MIALYRAAIVCFGIYNILFLVTGSTSNEGVRDIKDYLLSLTVVCLLFAIFLK